AARRGDLADLHRVPGRVPHRAQRAWQGLRVAEDDRRQAFELQERAPRVRAVPAQRSARPAEGCLWRKDHAAFRAGTGSLPPPAGDTTTDMNLRGRGSVQALDDEREASWTDCEPLCLR